MARIHPTASVDPGARLADDVEVGAGCVVEADVVIGAGTVLRPHAIVRRYTVLGKGNFVDSFAVLGGDPQDLHFDRGSRTGLEVGDANTFREGVTISRATKPEKPTRIGDRNLWMANSHAGHDVAVGSGTVIVNGTLLAGHSVIGDRAILSGNAMVHQFTWIGEGVMTQGGAGMGMHVPPFVLTAGNNTVVGLNAVGLRRNAALSDEDRRQIKQAFALTYRSRISPAKALAEMDACREWGPAASKFRDFVRKVLAAVKPHNRGLCPCRRRPVDAGD